MEIGSVVAVVILIMRLDKNVINAVNQDLKNNKNLFN